MMKNNIVIGIVVAMALGFVITGSTLTAVLAQGNMTAGGGGNMTAGGGEHDCRWRGRSTAIKGSRCHSKTHRQ